MSSTRIEDLVVELTDARKRIRQKQAAVDDRKHDLEIARQELRDAIKAKEEIEDEITDPGNRRPLLAAAAAIEAAASADEHQRGPTSLPDRSLPTRGQRRKRQKAHVKRLAEQPERADRSEKPGPAATRHYFVHRPADFDDTGIGPRIGTQIARSEAEAAELARKGWKGPVEIGEAFEHGPECGCGSDVVIETMAAAGRATR